MLGESGSLALAVTSLFAALAGIGVPWLGMRALIPALLRSGTTVENYRGTPVTLGLGFVWGFWALGAATFFAGLFVLGFTLDIMVPGLVYNLLRFSVPLVVTTFVFGLIDDVYGTSATRGFRGHLGALARGKVTTGGLKLVGVGTISLFGAVYLMLAHHVDGVGARVAYVVLATGVLALSANTLNLFDLRPGRALKAYLLYAGVALLVLLATPPGGGLAPDLVYHPRLVEGLLAACFLLGPVIAVWRFDLGEIAMLGDAGANAFGMLAGIVLLAGLPPVALPVPFVVLLVLNAASERVSFSAVIERTRLLATIDGWGRVGPERPDRSGSVE